MNGTFRGVSEHQVLSDHHFPLWIQDGIKHCRAFLPGEFNSGGQVVCPLCISGRGKEIIGNNFR